MLPKKCRLIHLGDAGANPGPLLHFIMFCFFVHSGHAPAHPDSLLFHSLRRHAGETSRHPLLPPMVSFPMSDDQMQTDDPKATFLLSTKVLKSQAGKTCEVLIVF